MIDTSTPLPIPSGKERRGTAPGKPPLSQPKVRFGWGTARASEANLGRDLVAERARLRPIATPREPIANVSPLPRNAPASPTMSPDRAAREARTASMLTARAVAQFFGDDR